MRSTTRRGEDDQELQPPSDDVPRVHVVALRNGPIGRTSKSSTPPPQQPSMATPSAQSLPPAAEHLSAALAVEAVASSRPHVRAEAFAFSEAVWLLGVMILSLQCAMHLWTFYPAESFIDRAADCIPVSAHDDADIADVRSNGWVMPWSDFLLFPGMGTNLDGSLAAPNVAWHEGACFAWGNESALTNATMQAYASQVGADASFVAPDFSSATLAICRANASGGAAVDIEVFFAPRTTLQVTGGRDNGGGDVLWFPNARHTDDEHSDLLFPGAPNIGRFVERGVLRHNNAISTAAVGLSSALRCLCSELLGEYDGAAGTVADGRRIAFAIATHDAIIESSSGDLTSEPLSARAWFARTADAQREVRRCRPTPASGSTVLSQVEALSTAAWGAVTLVSVGMAVDVIATTRGIRRYSAQAWIDGNVWVNFLLVTLFLVSAMPPALYFALRAAALGGGAPPLFTSGEAWIVSFWGVHMTPFHSMGFRAACIFFVLSLAKLPMEAAAPLPPRPSSLQRCSASLRLLLSDVSALRFTHHAIAFFYLARSLIIQMAIVALSLRLAPYAWSGSSALGFPPSAAADPVHDGGGGDGSPGSGFWISAMLPVFTGPAWSSPAQWFAFDARERVADSSAVPPGSLTGAFTSVGLPILVVAQCLSQIRGVVFRAALGLFIRYRGIVRGTAELVLGAGPRQGNREAATAAGLPEEARSRPGPAADVAMRNSASFGGTDVAEASFGAGGGGTDLSIAGTAPTSQLTSPKPSRSLALPSPQVQRSPKPFAGARHHHAASTESPASAAGFAATPQSGSHQANSSDPSVSLPVYQGIACRYALDGHRYATLRVVTYMLLPMIVIDLCADLIRTWFVGFTTDGPRTDGGPAIVFPQCNVYPSPGLIVLNALRVSIVWFFLLPRAPDASTAAGSDERSALQPLRQAFELKRSAVTQFSAFDAAERAPVEASIVKTLSTAATLVCDLRRATPVHNLVAVEQRPTANNNISSGHNSHLLSATDGSLATPQQHRLGAATLAFVNESGWTVAGSYESHEGVWLTAFMIGASSVASPSSPPPPPHRRRSSAMVPVRSATAFDAEDATPADTPMTARPDDNDGDGAAVAATPLEQPPNVPAAADSGATTPRVGGLGLPQPHLSQSAPGACADASCGDDDDLPDRLPATTTTAAGRAATGAQAGRADGEKVLLRYVVIVRHSEPTAAASNPSDGTPPQQQHASGVPSPLDTAAVCFTPANNDAGDVGGVSSDEIRRPYFGDAGAMRALAQDIVRCATEEFSPPPAATTTTGKRDRDGVSNAPVLYAVDFDDSRLPAPEVPAAVAAASRTSSVKKRRGQSHKNAAPRSVHDIAWAAASVLQAGVPTLSRPPVALKVGSVVSFDVVHAAGRGPREGVETTAQMSKFAATCSPGYDEGARPLGLTPASDVRRFNVHGLCPHGPAPFRVHQSATVTPPPPVKFGDKPVPAATRVILDVPPLASSSGRRHQLHPCSAIVDPSDAALRSLQYLAGWVEGLAPDDPVDLCAMLAAQT